MKISLFDLHADTPSELYRLKKALEENDLHISLQKATVYENYVQVMAIWSDARLGDEEAWEQFWKIRKNLLFELKKSDVSLFPNEPLLQGNGHRSALLAVEDARILAGNIDRLNTLYDAGVRFLTLSWSGETCVGGSFDTEAPLTPFGREVVERCFALGVVPDVSHASRAVTAETLEMAKAAKKPIVATHSNAFAVCAHPRNLTDSEFVAIAELGGIVGISLCPPHLTDGSCTVDTVVSHIQHYLSLGYENAIALGCDFDGIDHTPCGLSDISRLPALADALLRVGVPEATVRKLFFENALGFATAHI